MKKVLFLVLPMIILYSSAQDEKHSDVIDTARKIISEKVDSIKFERINELEKNIDDLNEAQRKLDSVVDILDSLKKTKTIKWKLAPVKLASIKKITFTDGRKPIYFYIYYKKVDGKYYFWKIVKK